ncbi:MAG: VWA domain-containing protein [Prevotellaceae bacterium]|nr:VWA domain-containing protein [Prevotellaceae bacterium]
MFRFDDIIFLWLLLLIPFLVLIRLIYWHKQKKRLQRLGDVSLLKILMPDMSRFRPTIKFILLIFALGILILMLARPQMGTRISQEKKVGIETIICMDISNSMKAEDVVPNRLEKSKLLVENLVDHFTNDKVGLVVFAGEAFVQLPITSDYVSAKMFLQDINPSLIATQGTDIAGAINLASHSFSQQQGVGRAIIVITDGEDHEGGALEAAKVASKNDINVFILGIGSTKGASIPIGNGEYMKDATGHTVLSSLNENMCKEIAKAGNGTYIHVDNTSDAQRDLNDGLLRLQRGVTSSVVYSDYNEQFQSFGIIVIILLFIEICILEIRNPHFRHLILFKTNKITK